MNFATKYEILEPVTRGSVETFVARIIDTGERALVYIFECPEQRPDQPTVQWVLESFHAVAPKAPELVLGSGRYSGTSYAYLVTKLPDSTVLQEWVRSYEAQEGAKEIPASPVSTAMPEPLHESKNNLSHHIAGADQPTVIRELKHPVETPTLPGDLPCDANASSETNDLPRAGQTAPSALAATIIDFSGTNFGPVGRVQLREPGESTGPWSKVEKTPEKPTQADDTSGTLTTKEPPLSETPADGLLDLDGKASTPGGVGSPNGVPSGTLQPVAPFSASPAEAAGTTDLFGFNDASQPQTSLNTASDKREDVKTGEFTSFFQGPFHGERSSQTPDLSPASSGSQKQPSEFTKVFGNNEVASSPGAIASPSRVNEIPLENDAEAPTHSFEDSNQLPLAVEKPLPSPAIRSRPPIDPPAQPTVPESSGGSIWRDSEPAFTSRLGTEGATSVFSAPARDLQSGLAATSDFTRIINGGSREPTPVEEPLMPSGSRDDSFQKLPPPGLPQFHLSLPATPPAPQFQQPVAPKMPTPAGIPAPSLPPASQLGSAAPRVAASPWMLILVMGGLVILAVLLVLYFALKH
jgi:hypothetical protein